MIKSHGTGKVEIKGRIYEEDIAVSSAGKIYNWNRQERKLTGKEAKKFLKESPEILIVGLGENGLLEIEKEVEEIMREKEIILFLDETREALRAFNKSIERGRKVFGVFPLTL